MLCLRKLYEKSELTFSLIFIAFYIVLFSVSDSLSAEIGLNKSITVVTGVVLSVIILIFIVKNGLLKKYGLCRIQNGKLTGLDLIFFLFIISANLWNGIELDFVGTETVCYIISMLFVGFIEEVIFRGFLFKALCKDSVITAVAVSSLTFGAGHIVNLLNSADITSTLLQICYASAVGFAFTVFFLKKGSLLPCVAVHSIFNSLSIFEAEAHGVQQVIIAVVLTVVPVVYGMMLLKKSDKIIDK